MSNIQVIVEGLESATVRKTEDGRYSVFDAIGICGAKNPRATYQRLLTLLINILQKNSPGSGNNFKTKVQAAKYKKRCTATFSIKLGSGQIDYQYAKRVIICVLVARGLSFGKNRS